MKMHLATPIGTHRFGVTQTDRRVDQHDGIDLMAKVKPPARRGARKPSGRGASTRGRSARPIRKRSGTRATGAVSSSSDVAADAAADVAAEDQLIFSSLSLHELFQQQTRQILDRGDLDEEQKQNILVAMSCPCCGAGAMSFTAKLRR